MDALPSPVSSLPPWAQVVLPPSIAPAPFVQGMSDPPLLSFSFFFSFFFFSGYGWIEIEIEIVSFRFGFRISLQPLRFTSCLSHVVSWLLLRRGCEPQLPICTRCVDEKRRGMADVERSTTSTTHVDAHRTGRWKDTTKETWWQRRKGETRR